MPILVNNYQFQDAIQSTARFATVNRQTPEDIRAAVLKEAQNEDIPITAQDIHIKGDAGHVEIAADYSVTVDLHVYQWTLNFHPEAQEQSSPLAWLRSRKMTPIFAVPSPIFVNLLREVSASVPAQRGKAGAVSQRHPFARV